MPVYRFASFQFDSERLLLSRQLQPCELRPKAAVLLRCLITQRRRIVGKQEIARSVWQSGFVADQSLFQTMSELRKALLPLTPIKTHPNLGYQWIEPVTTANALRRHAVAAVFLVAVSAATLITWSARNAAAPAAAGQGTTVGFAPTLAAFSSGLTHLQANDMDVAARFFELALRENPDFNEARLMLAEALLAQGLAPAARRHAQAIVDQSSATRDPYMSVAAMELLSRADHEAGQHAAALEWIVEAMNEARGEGFACAVVGLERRRVALMSPLHAPATTPEPAGLASAPRAPAAVAAPPDRCVQMQELAPQARQRVPGSAESFDRCAATAKKITEYSVA